MNKKEAQQRKELLQKELSKLDKIINAPEVTPQERFWQLMNGCIIYTEKEKPNSVFWIKNGKIFFELENSIFWCTYEKVWIIFEKEFSMQYPEIQSLIKKQVEERFKMNAVTPLALDGMMNRQVEERFKMNAVTPTYH